MNYPSIRIEGAILSPDVLTQVEELPGQRSADFAIESSINVKDEIARSWADAQDYWRIFQRKLESVREGSNATTETRNLWIVPLLGLLRYDIEYQSRSVGLNGRTYAISHRATNRGDAPVQIIGARDPAGLDKKPANATRRMSAHALVQEFLNLHDQLYGIVTNGRLLRLLRDSSRLVKQSYLEFDLDRIFSDGLFADFAVLYRLLHSTRLPPCNETAAESLIERYHQDSLDSGARIRAGLSRAVEQAIRNLGTGFLSHPANDVLRAAVTTGELSAGGYYQQLLRLIYRLLFLIVIEERDLVFPPDTSKHQREIYQKFYSVARLRRLSEKRYLADPRRHDLWLALEACFALFEADGRGLRLGVAPLAGDLFSTEAMGALNGCMLSNGVVLGCLRSLGLYEHPQSGQLIRVNYASLNVEEFGSVYEGLLEYAPEFVGDGPTMRFELRRGTERAATGSHYTPDDLVQPLIRHSLDHLIAERLRAEDAERALLDLRVADIACGSGHILLAAARRIATDLAIVRTSEEQPSPPAFRSALRDVIRHCIYGVDLNPLAVELCRVALWLEAHIPGQPLNFLDHHIKCGNAIVGFSKRKELAQGIPTEAFKARPGDDKGIAATYRKRNQAERNKQNQTLLDFKPELSDRLAKVLEEWQRLSALPETTPAQVEDKKKRFAALVHGEQADVLRTVANIPLVQFYIPKVPSDTRQLVTDGEFQAFLNYELTPRSECVRAARSLGKEKRFFHWFLEFPEIMEEGGFDCILGNPPYLGRKRLTGTFGHAFCDCMKWRFAPTGLSELVVYFLRRAYELLSDRGFIALITTNSIVDGDIRKDGLEQVVKDGATITMGVRGVKWPGAANLIVSLLAIHKGKWSGPKMLDNQPVESINFFFEEGENVGAPHYLAENRHRMFQGSIFLGDGFLLTHEEADRMRAKNIHNSEVIMPIINGRELNNSPNYVPGRSVINFRDWPLERAQFYQEPFQRVLRLVKPIRDEDNMKSRRDNWWRFGALASGIYDNIHDLQRCFATAWTTKHLSFSAMPTDIVFSNAVYVFTTDRWDLFAVVQSTIHEIWARKYSGALKQDLRYSSSKCFDTFPFPPGVWEDTNPYLATVGERYHAHRSELMLSLGLGLTKVYNLFHTMDLTPEMVAKVSKNDAGTAARCYDALLELRHLHIALDFAVRDAYDWREIELGHGFHEVETLPEKDRVRHTISPGARRTLLNGLLAENHCRSNSAIKNQR